MISMAARFCHSGDGMLKLKPLTLTFGVSVNLLSPGQPGGKLQNGAFQFISLHLPGMSPLRQSHVLSIFLHLHVARG